jgi:flagellin
LEHVPTSRPRKSQKLANLRNSVHAYNGDARIALRTIKKAHVQARAQARIEATKVAIQGGVSFSDYQAEPRVPRDWGVQAVGKDAVHRFLQGGMSSMASFSVVNNIASANAQANLATTNIGLQQALNRLSSGLRINRSGDDAAGLAVANTYRSTIAVLNQGMRNAGDGLSTLQIKDGALNNISNLLDRLATLATESASSSATVSRSSLNLEFQDVLTEIDREANVAGLTASAGFSIFVSNDATNGIIGGTVGAANVAGLSLTGTAVDTDVNAQAALTSITSAIAALGTTQAQVGTIENRLQYAISLAQSQIVNNQAAESRIRDANVAQEASNLTKYQILTQSGVAALAQANQSTGAVLALLR